MKYLFSITILLIFSIIANAQRDVTKFLGIPVDGSKTAMIQKLKAKGFQVVPGSDGMKGEFNGEEVALNIKTNKNKVCRIGVAELNTYTKNGIKKKVQHPL